TAYRAAGGQRAIVSTIIVTGTTDTGALREQLTSYADAGFDDAVLMVYPGAPSLEALRSLV
ncbi:MAG: 5,10-methylene tetrahydromethanopterin reductase, partial [Gammaproteobacteria bacterium]